MSDSETQSGERALIARSVEEDVGARFLALQNVDHQREQSFAAWLATQSTLPLPCSSHPDVMRQVDRQESFGSDCDTPGQWRLIYTACPVCAEDRQLLRSGVPPVLAHARFENFQPADETDVKCVEAAREFARRSIGFLSMVGNLGTGKSHLAVAIMRSFKRAVFVKQSTLLLMLRGTYRDKAAVDPVELCQRASLLVLDEIGLTAGGKDELPMLHEILDFRYGQRKATVLTCNISTEELKSVLGERMVDRLEECSFAYLGFRGKSHRPDAKSRYFNAPLQSNSAPLRMWWEDDRFKPPPF